MDEQIYNLHIESGRIVGKDKTCGKKVAFLSEENASTGAAAHNRWIARRHDVEPYPCAFCNKWHIGNIMPPELMEELIRNANRNTI